MGLTEKPTREIDVPAPSVDWPMPTEAPERAPIAEPERVPELVPA